MANVRSAAVRAMINNHKKLFFLRVCFSCSCVFVLSLSFLSLFFKEKKGDFGIETGFGERIRDAYAKDGVGLRRR